MNWRRRIKGDFEAFGGFEHRDEKLNEKNKYNIINSSRTILENIPIVLKSPKSLKRGDGGKSEIQSAEQPHWNQDPGSDLDNFQQWPDLASRENLSRAWVPVDLKRLERIKAKWPARQI